jgi:tetratricopeptide (TPR) repeat protein
MPDTSVVSVEEIRVSIDPDQLVQLKALEREAVQLAEHGHIEGAIFKFTEAIALNSQYASAYNNRAQALRLVGRLDEAMDDLNTAVPLATGQPRLLGQIYTQRATIHKAQDRPEEAKKDFASGAACGNAMARHMSVDENPYAKMCHAMVLEAMRPFR